MRQNSATAGPARVIWINGTFGAGETQTAYELGRRISGAYVSAGRGGALGCVSRAERDAAGRNMCVLRCILGPQTLKECRIPCGYAALF